MANPGITNPTAQEALDAFDTLLGAFFPIEYKYDNYPAGLMNTISRYLEKMIKLEEVTIVEQ